MGVAGDERGLSLEPPGLRCRVRLSELGGRGGSGRWAATENDETGQRL